MCGRRFFLVLTALVAVTAWLQPLAMGGDKTGNKKIRVILIDGQNNHNWVQTTPFLKKVLEESGHFTVDVSSNLGPKNAPHKDLKTVPFPPDLNQYDVLLSNYNGAPWPKEFNDALESTLKEGKIGLVIVHAANNSFTGKWAEYDRMIGMGWRNNNYGDRLTLDANGKEVRVPKGQGPGAGHGSRYAFVVSIRDGNHPVTRGMPLEWMHAKDELYQGMRGPIENVHLLATSFADPKKGGKSSSGEHEPMIWTVSYGKGKVFHTPMGHDLEAMRCVGFITTLQRGTEWAATGKVTIPIPRDFPTAGQTSSVPEK
jgi:type 1 glutamine amidotransferase